MEKQQLKQARVVFFEEGHRYLTADGRELSGITSIIKRLVFPDKYKGVDQTTLAESAAKGTAIHNMCEEFALSGTVSDFMPDEVTNFVTMCSVNGLRFIDSEYLVSDGGQNFATRIDLVDENCNLYDIKTTSSLDKEYLSWQLSIGAAFFEMQNPGVEVGKLFGIWLHDDRSALVEVPRLPDSAVEQLLIAAMEGGEFHNPLKLLAETERNEMTLIASCEASIIRLKVQIKELEATQKEAKDFMLQEMKKRGVKTLETDNLRITVKEAYERKSVDTDRLKKTRPEIYKEYEKTSKVAESLVITLK